MKEEESEKSGSVNSKINRRDFLQKSVATTVVGSGGLGATGTAASKQGHSGDERKVSEVPHTEITSVTSSEPVTRVLDNLNSVELTEEKATKIQIRSGDEVASSVISVPTSIGYLTIIQSESVVEQAQIKIKRDSLHESTRARIEAVKDWPQNTTGYLRAEKTATTVDFLRTCTASEKSSLTRAVDDKGGKVTATVQYPLPHTVRGKATAEHLLINGRKYYKVGANGKIKESGTIGGSGVSLLGWGCSDYSAACLADIAIAYGGCSPALVACGITGVATPACVIAVLSICAPEAALVAVSGNCEYVADNCL